MKGNEKRGCAGERKRKNKMRKIMKKIKIIIIK
jgi:hypothetical protein